VAIEIASVVNHLVRYPVNIGHRWAVAPVHDQSERPLVVLPGLADNASIFRELKQSLENCGAGPVVSFSYSSLLGSVQTAAARLAVQIEELCTVSGASTVDMVGHSLGGLIARYYVQRLGGHARVATVVTLATPHSGTIAAKLPSPLPLIRQLRPGSDLLVELTEPAPGCPTRFVAFAGDRDELILPSRNALLNHPDLQVRNVVVRGAGHTAIASHPHVLAQICTLFGPHETVGVPLPRSA
jgi:pimeloyl-ACP methyl ester carboxylesterase